MWKTSMAENKKYPILGIFKKCQVCNFDKGD
jgi:hypothetical protein